MRQIERYVMMELLRTFGGLITISTLLLLFVGIFSETRKFNLGILQILQIMPYFVPNMLPYTIPATLLLTVCVVYGRMAGDNEIIAIRAAGVHIIHLIWPSFFLAALLSIFALVLTDQGIPWACNNIERIIAMAMEDIVLDTLRTENQINDKSHGITINAMEVRGRKLIGPTIKYSSRNGGESLTMQAQSAIISFDLRRRQVLLTLEQMQGNLGNNRTIYLENDRIPYELPGKASTAGNRALRTNEVLKKLGAMYDQQKDARRGQAIEAAFALSRGCFDDFQSPAFCRHQGSSDAASSEIRGLRTEYYNRFAMSTSCFFFVLLGSPFAILMAKKQFLTSFLFCFLPILTVYYPIAMMTQNMSKSGQVDPVWALWLANGTLLLASGYYFRKVFRN